MSKSERHDRQEIHVDEEDPEAEHVTYVLLSPWHIVFVVSRMHRTSEYRPSETTIISHVRIGMSLLSRFSKLIMLQFGGESGTEQSDQRSQVSMMLQACVVTLPAAPTKTSIVVQASFKFKGPVCTRNSNPKPHQVRMTSWSPTPGTMMGSSARR